MTAEIFIDLGECLVIPSEAVLDTGKRKILFVSKEDGVFEPRSVAVGAKTEDGIEIKGGVVEGERVVTKGNFLIDSESRLKAAIEGMEVSSTSAGHEGEHHHGQ
jgi:multidrug efflux pump subunit AcrA (membrane-fusion protein)